MSQSNTAIVITDLNEIASDHKYAKQNIIDAIEQAKNAMDEVEDIARTSQHPGAWRVYGELLSKFIDANEAIMRNNLIKSRMDDKLPREEQPKTVNHNNNLFVGSTKELLDMIEKKKRADNDN